MTEYNFAEAKSADCTRNRQQLLLISQPRNFGDFLSLYCPFPRLGTAMKQRRERESQFYPTQKHDIFTCENNMLSSHVKMSLSLWQAT